MGRLARGLVLAGLAVSLAGCGVLPRNPVPPELTAVATIPGMPDVRAWAGRPSAAMERDLEQSFDQESPRGLPARRRRPRSLSSPRAVRRRLERRLRRRIPERLDGHRESPGLQDRHRRVDRRADGAVRVPRPAVRRRAARVLHDDGEPRHLRRRVVPGLAPARRFARRHRAARGADRAARRRRVPAQDRRRARSRPAAVHRHASTSTPSSSSSGTWG